MLMLLKIREGNLSYFFCCSQKYWIHIFARNFPPTEAKNLPHGGYVDKRFAFPTKTEVFSTKTDVVMREDRYE